MRDDDGSGRWARPLKASANVGPIGIGALAIAFAIAVIVTHTPVGTIVAVTLFVVAIIVLLAAAYLISRGSG